MYKNKKKEGAIMKKSLAVILVLVLFVSFVGIVPAFAADDDDIDLPAIPFIKEDVAVTAVFAGVAAQEIQGPEDAPQDVEPIKVDSICIFYSDNTFDQYAETPSGYELFSTGTYSFKEDADFIISEDGDNGVIVIEREQVFSMDERKLVDNASTEEYDMDTLDYVQLFGPEDGKEVEAIFGDTTMTLYEDEDGVLSKLDTVWLYFTDGTFCDYVFLNDSIVLYCSGTYEFDEAGDFHILPFEEDYGTITQTFNQSMAGREGQSKSINLGAMGLTCLYEKYDENLVLPELPAKAG